MDKPKDLKKLITEINQTNKEKHHVIPTNIKSLDYILGGGLELGGKVQFVAESSTGKSTIALQISKSFCEQGLNVLYVDTENSITKELLKSTGCINYINNEEGSQGEFVLLKESDYDTVSNYLDKCFKSKYFEFIVIDSLASMVSNCYTDIDSSKDVKSLTNNNTNYESRPLNLFINKYSNLANKYNVAILYVNQYRNKVDPKNGTILKEFGNKIVKYNSDIILKIKKDKEILWQDQNKMFSNDYKTNEKTPPTHAKLSFVLDKSNKLLTGTSIDTYIKYGYGIDEVLDDILDRVRNDEIQKDGKYYTLPEQSEKYDGLINLVNHIISKSYELCEDDAVSCEEDCWSHNDGGKITLEFITDDYD